MPPLPRGLYAITDPVLIPGQALVETVARAIRGGAVMIQYRNKDADPARRSWEAQDLSILCRPLGVPFIVNDDVGLARECAAAGVHLGRDDGDIAAARTHLGPDAIIGVSCYDDLERALAAAAAGADYVAFGSFFPSPTKPQAPPADLALIRAAKRRLAIPVCAIGGINADNCAPLVAAGVDLLAVINGVFAQPDVVAAAQRVARCFG